MEDMPVITTANVHGVSPTTSVYQSSALLTHVTLPAARPDLTREKKNRPTAKGDFIVDERVLQVDGTKDEQSPATVGSTGGRLVFGTRHLDVLRRACSAAGRSSHASGDSLHSFD